MDYFLIALFSFSLGIGIGLLMMFINTRSISIKLHECVKDIKDNK